MSFLLKPAIKRSQSDAVCVCGNRPRKRPFLFLELVGFRQICG
jgi:hypothetical protein